MKAGIGIHLAAVLCCAASVAARADFAIDVDMSADPIKDVRTSTCGPEVGYAGCLFPIDGPNEPADTYWFKTRAADTSRAMREAGAWFQRMWLSEVRPRSELPKTSNPLI